MLVVGACMCADRHVWVSVWGVFDEVGVNYC